MVNAGEIRTLWEGSSGQETHTTTFQDTGHETETREEWEDRHINEAADAVLNAGLLTSTPLKTRWVHDGLVTECEDAYDPPESKVAWAKRHEDNVRGKWEDEPPDTE